MSPEHTNLVVVANRLPVDRVESDSGEVSWRRSPGGLVTALAPVMRGHGGAWVGWAGGVDDAPEPFHEDGMELVAVPLSAADVAHYYEGLSNSTLWPLYHDVIVPAEYNREWWDAYVGVNARFAEAAEAVAGEGATVWVQDYQLQLVPSMLRERRPDLRIGFFLHIPFPPTELFAQLPWRRRILEGLLGADLVGFQRRGAVANFVQLTERLLGLPAVETAGDGVDAVVTSDGRTVRAAAFPISIDATELDELSRTPEVEKRAIEIRAELGEPRRVLLGVDRLDYTKGIGHRLKAFGELLADGTVTPEDAVLVQVATPSRERVEHYRVLRDEIEQSVGRINGEHARLGHPAVHYLHSSHDRPELAALFRAADVMVVTPLRDGMNLVAKEYVACRHDLHGALVLSEFAGAADELSEAFLVNPHDVDDLKRVIVEAMWVEPAEARSRMQAMRTHVFTHDVTRWARTFLDTLATG